MAFRRNRCHSARLGLYRVPLTGGTSALRETLD